MTLFSVSLELAAGRLAADTLPDVLTYCRRSGEKLDEVLRELGLTPATPEQVNDRFRGGATPSDMLYRGKDINAAHRCVMGVVMRTMRGRFPGKSVAESVAAALKPF
jgi:Glu-tRNA(Gln) amidotransferase subunit E-like FAD-binding protein